MSDLGPAKPGPPDAAEAAPAAAEPLVPAAPLTVIRASGTHYEIGGAIGQAYRGRAEETLAYYDRVLRASAGMGLDQASAEVMRYLPYAREALPELVEEVRGIADGAGVGFEAILVLNLLEELESDLPRLRCTSIGLVPDRFLGTRGGCGLGSDRGPAPGSPREVWLAHNEDWCVEDASRVAVVIARPRGEPAFLSVISGPLLPAVGFNEAGVGQGVDSVYPVDMQMGVPRTFVSRHVLEARALGEAIRFACLAGRAGGYNHLLATADGEIYNLETTGRDFDAIYGEGLLVHTNHYLSPHLRRLSDPPSPTSIIRVNRAGKLVRDCLAGGLEPKEALSRTLSDHVNYPGSICVHPRPDAGEGDAYGTVFTLVAELVSRRAWVSVGPPCRAEPVELTL